MKTYLIKISKTQATIIDAALRSFYAAPLYGLMIDVDPGVADEHPALIDMMGMLDDPGSPDTIADFTE
jgi:hypothetical protein